MEAYRESIRNTNEAIAADHEAGEAGAETRDSFGGSIQLRQSLSRSVTLDEDFGQPLVIGYLGYDLPIRKNGDLGPAVATLARIENREVGSIGVSERTVDEQLYRLMKIDLDGFDDDEMERRAVVFIARGLKQAEFEPFTADDPSNPNFASDFLARLDRFVAGDPVRQRRVLRLWNASLEALRSEG